MLSRLHFCWASNQQNVQLAASMFPSVLFYCYSNMERDWSNLQLMQALPRMVANLVDENQRWRQVNVDCKAPIAAMQEQAAFLADVYDCWNPEGDGPHM